MCADDEEEEGVFIERGKERAKKKGLTPKKRNPKFLWRKKVLQKKRGKKRSSFSSFVTHTRESLVALHFFSSSSSSPSPPTPRFLLLLLTKASDKSQNADEDEDVTREREREKFSFEERKEEEEEEEEDEEGGLSSLSH